MRMSTLGRRVCLAAVLGRSGQSWAVMVALCLEDRLAIPSTTFDVKPDVTGGEYEHGCSTSIIHLASMLATAKPLGGYLDAEQS